MKKITKKQMAVTGVIVVLGIGGITAGVVNHNSTVHAQQVAKTKAHDAKVKADKKAKSEQLIKEKEATQQKQVGTLLSTATANPSDNAIKAVNDAIAKLTDQKEKSKDTELVKGLNARLSLIKKAEAAVKDYQGHATDANKQKIAQGAINNLKDKNDQDVKSQLQKMFDESNKQAQEAAKSSHSAEVTNKTESTNTETNNQSSSSANASDNSYSANTPNRGGGSGTASDTNSGNYGSNSNNSNNSGGGNSNNSSNNSGGGNSNNSSNNNGGGNSNNSNNSNGGGNSNNNNNNNNGGGNTTPPVKHVYQGWVKNGAGVVVATFNADSANAASSWASNYANAHFSELFVNGNPGSVGYTQLS